MSGSQVVAGIEITRDEGAARFARRGPDFSAILRFCFWAMLGVCAVSGVGVYLFERAIAACIVIMSAIFAGVASLVRLIDESTRRGGLEVMKRALVIRRGASTEGAYREAARTATIEVDGRTTSLDEVRGVHIAHTMTQQQHGGVVHQYTVYLVLPKTAIQIGRGADADSALELSAILADELGLSPSDVTLSDTANPLGLGMTMGLAVVLCAQIVAASLAISEISDFGHNRAAVLLLAPIFAIGTLAIDALISRVFGPWMGENMQMAMVPVLAADPPPASAEKKKRRKRRPPQA